MRWCFISPGYRSVQVLAGDTRGSGGAEAQIAHLAAALARLGNEVGLIYGDGQVRARRQVIAGVTCIDAAPSWSHPGSLAAFWRAMDRFSPDQLYARLPSDFLWIAGLFARHHEGVRFLYALAHDLHCSPWSAYDYNRWFHAPLYVLGLIGADTIAVQHDDQRRLVSRRLRSRLAYVPNLVRSIREYPREYGATTFDAAWVANIRPEKQLEVFLDLAAGLPDRRFAVVGGFDTGLSAATRTSLEAQLFSLKNLTYLGPQCSKEIMALLTQSKVLVNTSRAEGFPNTMLEAWSTGVPVVSLLVDPGGVIEREKLGLVSRSFTNLLRDVAALSSQEPLNQEFGNRGLSYVRQRHSLAAVCEALTRALPGVQLDQAAVAGITDKRSEESYVESPHPTT